jgi:hypothetical protein
MIQPLRKIHRTVFLILGMVLPVLFISGLLARHAPLSPSDRTKGALKGSKVTGGTEFVMNTGSTMHKVRLIESTISGSDREFELIPDSGFLAPDVFLYWSPAKKESSIDPGAKLLGKFSPRERYRIPAGAGGYFVLYSVAQNQVLASIPIGAKP